MATQAVAQQQSQSDRQIKTVGVFLEVRRSALAARTLNA
jgi:hypothetical protein